MEARVVAHGLPATAEQFRALKAMGFSDARLAKLASSPRRRCASAAMRWACGRSSSASTPAPPSSPSPTAYMYSTYERGLRIGGGRSSEAAPSDRDKVIILGGGPNRIGQGIEFDYCCCHACFALSARPAPRPSWSTAIPRRSRPTTTPPTGSISSR